MNEKFAPELLEHKTEIVDCILDQIKEMVSEHCSMKLPPRICFFEGVVSQFK